MPDDGTLDWDEILNEAGAGRLEEPPPPRVTIQRHAVFLFDDTVEASQTCSNGHPIEWTNPNPNGPQVYLALIYWVTPDGWQPTCIVCGEKGTVRNASNQATEGSGDDSRAV